MPPDFAGKFGIVTGAASGIGRATTCMLAQRGCRVLAVDRDESGLDSLANTFAGGSVIGHVADVSRPEEVRRYVDCALSLFGSIDVFFNNAGIAGPFKEIQDLTLEEWHRSVDINLHGVFYGTKYVVAAMRERRGGSIVITGSNLSLFGAATRVDYAATKHAILGIARAVATEAGADGVRVNVVCPGPVDTPMLHDVERYLNPENPDQIRRAYESISPMNRYATPDEIAETVCFLLSDRAAYVSGIPMPVDGGFSAF